MRFELPKLLPVYISLAEAAAKLPVTDGKRIHAITIKRWINKGIKGVKLEARLIGNRWFTTEEWLEDFFKNRTTAAMGTAIISPARVDRERKKHAAQVRKRLEEEFGFDSLPLGMCRPEAIEAGRLLEWEAAAEKIQAERPARLKALRERNKRREEERKLSEPHRRSGAPFGVTYEYAKSRGIGKEWIAEYERSYGRKPNEADLR